MTPGYIYILQNASLSASHLKIGRTTGHPDVRASELSRATGVPSPFVAEWYAETDDCCLAEKLLHQRLAVYRTNPSREFFDVDLSIAIAAAEYAVIHAGGVRRHAGGASFFEVIGDGIIAMLTGGWKILAFTCVCILRVIWFLLTLCLTLCLTLPMAFVVGLLSGFSKPPRRRRKSRW